MTTSTRKQQDGGRAHDLTVISLGRSTNTGVDEVVVPAGGDGDPTVIGRAAAHDETADDGQSGSSTTPTGALFRLATLRDPLAATGSLPRIDLSPIPAGAELNGTQVDKEE